MAALRKKAAPLRLVEVKPNDELKGHVFLMRGVSTRLYLEMRSKGGMIEKDELLRETLAAIVDSTLDCDPADLHPLQIQDLGYAWIDVWEEAALPNSSGRRSPRPSPSSPSTRRSTQPSPSATPSTS